MSTSLTPSPVYSTEIFLTAHYYQNAQIGRFQMYDYGAENLDMYGSKSPPDYALDKVVAPTIIYQAFKDTLVPREVKKINDRST